MYKLFRMELLKSKRTLLRPVLFIGAVIFAVLLMIVANLAPDTLENSWEHYTKMIFNMWTISFNTLGISLLCILSEYEEKKNNTYRSIYVEAYSVKRVWTVKVFTLAFYSFVATALLTIFVCGLALCNHLGMNTVISILEILCPFPKNCPLNSLDTGRNNVVEKSRSASNDITALEKSALFLKLS